MKKLHILLGLGLLASVFAGCNEDPELTSLRKVTFDGTLTASANAVVLTEENSAAQALALSWQSVDYYMDAPVTYSLQMTTVADSATWASAQTVEVGDDVVTASLTGGQLNDIAKQLGMEPNLESGLVIRVRSYVDRAAYSGTVVVKVTPYKVFSGYPALWVPGDYQGWDPSTAPRIVSMGDNQIYEGYIFIPAGGTMQFKLTAQAAWEPMAYGDGGDGVLIEANYSGGNFTVASEGYYNLAANLADMTYSVTKTAWSIIGDATPGGWGTDTPMAFDPVTQLWTVTAEMSTGGSFKFRANNAWEIDFGIDGDGKLTYADHPVLGYTPGLGNLTVPESGNYTLTLDLRDPENYKYSLKKN
ncbi:MAG: SusE domain-containing protein [Breznakibacter sp.]